jgi:CheY-like chemotaxis protein
LKLLIDTKPSLAIIDDQLPGMRGAQLAKQVKSRYADVRILLLSNEGKADGVDAIAPKPLRWNAVSLQLEALGLAPAKPVIVDDGYQPLLELLPKRDELIGVEDVDPALVG